MVLVYRVQLVLLVSVALVRGSLGTSGVGGVGVSGSLGTSGVGGVGVSGSLGTSGVGGVGGVVSSSIVC